MEVQMAQFDKVTEAMEAALERVFAFKDSRVKLPKAELDLLKTFEDARDIMNDMLRKTSADRQKLADAFGGDCTRIGRVQVCLDNADGELSAMNADDQRLRGAKEACHAVEKVLDDMGLGFKMQEAVKEEEVVMERRRTSVDVSAVALAAAEFQAEESASLAAQMAALAMAEVEVKEAPAPAPPPAPEPKRPLNRIEAEWQSKCDEDLIERILACTEPEELQAFAEEVTAAKAAKIGNWMIWMVHRAHLNDPTLVKFDFTNLKMPSGDMEPRISPKLALAMEVNTCIMELNLACSNLQGTEAACLAVSLRSNRALLKLNIDSNALQPLEIESIANGVAFAQTLQEIRCNNVSQGRQVYEAIANCVKANTFIVKVGLEIKDPHFRGQIDGQITRNNDAARKRRVEAKKAAEAAAKAAAAPA
jgi:hypothetical protein